MKVTVIVPSWMMATGIFSSTPPLLLLLLLLLLSLSLFLFQAQTHDHQTYIVYLGEHSEGKTDEDQILVNHHSILKSIKTSEIEAEESLVHSYSKVIDGFSAVLSEEEAKKLSETEGVVSIFPSRKFSLHTTRSWEFLQKYEELIGEEKNLLPSATKQGKDVIVGIIDSGIWPESESFGDEGLGPVPSKWRGICQEGDSFNSTHCNRKIIGARYFVDEYEKRLGPLNRSYTFRSPRDNDGHGTHTASTVAGRAVRGASALGGFANGTATGGSPARIAVYKVCWPTPGPNPNLENYCFESDLLRAIDLAVYDGVDVLSISIGANFDQSNYTTDGIALGALRALKFGIVVACSGGNSGPSPATVLNLAPWLITVGASSIDRSFPAPVVLGNGMTIKGETLTVHHLKKKQYFLIFAGDAEVPGVSKEVSGQCLPDSLSKRKVRGKIVLCLRGYGLRVEKGLEVLNAGGAGFILGNGPSNGNELTVDSHVLPATAVTHDDAVALLMYINSTARSTARLVPATTAVGVKPTPFVAAFSSRGPNPIEPNILKPDITAPGLNILAAWTAATGPTKLSFDRRIVKYNVYSGTSMACPHVSGTVALLKSIHPRWSSAAIRSAMMTTATTVNDIGAPITTAFGKAAGPFEYGSGHIRQAHAVDPGLVYDATYTDYILFGCASVNHSYDPQIPCPSSLPKTYNLNHPSVAVSNLRGTVEVKRTVTNVGTGRASYKADVSHPLGIKVVISPDMLHFTRRGQRKKFQIKMKAERNTNLSHGEYTFGSYSWTDGVHIVRSPIVVSLA